MTPYCSAQPVRDTVWRRAPVPRRWGSALSAAAGARSVKQHHRRHSPVPQRVHLEPPSSAWKTAFLTAARRSRGLHRPWIQAPSEPHEFTAYLRRRSSAANPGYLVVDSASGSLAGVVNLNEVVQGGFQSAYLAYYAFVPFEARGFLSAGLSLAITDAFRRLKLHRLEANIQPGNARSIALVKRLGFRLEGLSPRYLKVGGRWRDHERWAVLAEEWRGRERQWKR